MIRIKKPRVYKDNGLWRVSVPMRGTYLVAVFCHWRDALVMALANAPLRLR